ncbi:hypothetical protein SAMN05660330_00422 [Desulforhopalus singaporensis]|uniref:Uncharacterized protein n=1 Tax=Desulforhopalus singaporensis TaxID=91360 RepID=A0A1H0K362_9BACT|nr:hypothetical protein SAMN05660330_00422 [Desulforhopalus singaporensis]
MCLHFIVEYFITCEYKLINFIGFRQIKPHTGDRIPSVFRLNNSFGF